MASQFASRPFATFLLACLLGDFTSSFILPNLLSSILSVNFSLMRPPFISIASSRPTPSSPTVYVILPPIDGESATTTTTQATPTIPPETTTISAPELSPTVATTPVVEPQPIMANAPEPPGGVNGDAAESPPANAP
ncbi:allergen Asp f 7 homolog [Bactrocera tryoni]|uniref:allergen Asp f 7 homolog n=1 Tax=Bactrocera tryoni TaxID=59916 RepID=UPI001A9702F7|nr:allergen Asp f 7 homolog [Bactrocera tryoni]